MAIHRMLRGVIAALVLVSLVLQGTMVLAGTTGTLSGIVEDASSKTPIAGVKVTVASPAQTATATTDSSGRFTFLSLAPDTYVVSVEKAGYDTASIQGVTVAADTSQTLTVDTNRAIREIGRTTSRAASSLIKPGTTADVYSVTPAQQDAASPMGGGGMANSAFSALATVPGVFVQPNQSGYIGAGSTISIRGGDYNQIGYEIDGIPVNRAYDSYPSGPTSSLGQQELQVYTGAAPANAEAQGLSGFINQVIKTGTYPNTYTLNGTIGGPSLYNKGSLEISGSTENRLFTYYLAAGGYTARSRFIDQFNGAGIAYPYGQPLGPCVAGLTAAQEPTCFAPNGTFLANGLISTGFQYAEFNSTRDYDNVANLHFLFPRANGLKDDLQLMGMVNWIHQTYSDSVNDQGGNNFVSNVVGTGPQIWQDGRTYTGALLTAPSAANVQTYFYPFSTPHTFQALMPVNQEATQDNNQALYKIGYTHPFSENLIAKIYGYSYYGSWWDWDPNTYFINYEGLSGNYNVQNHTHGVSGSLIGQFGNHLITLLGSFTNTTTNRFNDATEANSSAIVASRVDASQVASIQANGTFNGICYSTTGVAVSCFKAASAASPNAGGGISISQLATGSAFAASGAGCPTGCALLATDTGYKGSFNDASPRNQAFSLTDQWQAGPNLTINGGLRLDNYGFVLSSTAYGPARTFWYSAYNQSYCTNAGGFFVAKKTITDTCAAEGLTTTPVTNLTSAQNVGWLVWQPRIGFTYRLGRDNVIRASYGRYSQAPNAAFEQYDAAEANAPSRLYSTDGFQIYGFTTPNHPVLPQTSNNLDFSWEHQFRGTDMAIKFSPFLRKTQNQIQQFFLNQQTNFVSGLNVGNQTAQGVEFEFDKGDFGRNGWAAKFSFAYTNSYIRYSTLPNGASLLTGINNAITQYNAYTSACAPGGKSAGTALCGGTVGGAAAAPCYTAAGAADNACLAGSIANPYWNAPVQNILNTNGNYPAYDIPPGPAPGAGTYYAYGAPYTATLLLQYKHDRLAITPALQFYAGQKYSSPISNTGIAPDTCTGGLAGATGGDPRYNYGAVGGAPYDATTCNTFAGANGFGGIPDPATATFDTLGQFTAPANVQLHLQVAYDVSPKLTLTATFANLWNSCFGGSKEPWNVQGACGYTSIANGLVAPVGNAYNPGTAISPVVAFPYIPTFGGLPGAPNLPFSFYLNLRIKT